MSASLLSRCARKSLLSKVMTPTEVAHKFFKNGMTVGWSGFTPAGYPKVVPIAVADMVEKEGALLVEGDAEPRTYVYADRGFWGGSAEA